MGYNSYKELAAMYRATDEMHSSLIPKDLRMAGAFFDRLQNHISRAEKEVLAGYYSNSRVTQALRELAALSPR